MLMTPSSLELRVLYLFAFCVVLFPLANTHLGSPYLPMLGSAVMAASILHMDMYLNISADDFWAHALPAYMAKTVGESLLRSSDQGAAREHKGRGAFGRLPLSTPADHGVHWDTRRADFVVLREQGATRQLAVTRVERDDALLDVMEPQLLDLYAEAKEDDEPFPVNSIEAAQLRSALRCETRARSAWERSACMGVYGAGPAEMTGNCGTTCCSQFDSNT